MSTTRFHLTVGRAEKTTEGKTPHWASHTVTANSVEELADLIQSLTSPRLWYTLHTYGERGGKPCRSKADWTSSGGVLFDLDPPGDSAGPLEAEARQALLELLRSGQFPFAFGCPSIKGLHGAVLFDRAITDVDEYAALAEHFTALVQEVADAACAEDRRIPRLAVDPAPLALTGMLYAPSCEDPKGRKRSERLIPHPERLVHEVEPILLARQRHATGGGNTSSHGRVSFRPMPLQSGALIADVLSSWPNQSGVRIDCPICGATDAFGWLADDPRRWACHGARKHPTTRVGVEGNGCWHGDVHDLVAYQRGCSRAEVIDAERASWPDNRDGTWGGVRGADSYSDGLRIAWFLGRRVRFAPGLGWLRFDGTRYVPLSDDMVRNEASVMLKERARELHSQAKAEGKAGLAEAYKVAIRRAGTPQGVNNALTFARGHVGIRLTAEELDSYPHHLNLANGVLDLRAGSLAPHGPEWLFTHASTISWDPNALCPFWMKFVLECASGDSAVAAFLQEVAGYALWGERPHEIGFLLFGDSGSGKSTFAGTIIGLLGGYGHTTGFHVLNAGGNSAHQEGLAALRGKRLLYVPEVGDERVHTPTLKEIIEGAETTVSHKGERAFPMRFRCLLMLSGNQRPKVTGDQGVAERLVEIPFMNAHSRNPARDRGLPAADPTLKPRLLHELPGILVWAVEGLQRLQRRGGFDSPPAIREATEELHDDEERPIASFLMSALEPCEHPNLWPTKEDVIGRWLARQGLGHEDSTATRSQFWKAVRETARSHKRLREMTGLQVGERMFFKPHGQVRVLRGVQLRQDTQPRRGVARREFDF